jgi:hypothetical protein
MTSLASVDGVLMRLEQSTYASLGDPWLTVQNCSVAVDRSLRSRNARILREFVRRERLFSAVGAVGNVVECVLNAVASAEMQPAEVRFTQRLRETAREALTEGAAAEVPSIHNRSGLIAEGIVAAIRAFDASLADHSEAVAALAVRLAGELDFTIAQRETLSVAARIHEIGRLQIGLGPIGRISDSDRAVKRRGLSRAGAALGLSYPELADASVVVRDALDRGRTPDAFVSPESVVLDFVDRFCSMTSERSYRRALAPIEAVRQLSAETRSPYEIEVLSALMRVVGLDERRLHRSA